MTGIAHVIHDILCLFLLTQSRAPNIPLFLLFEAQLRLLSTLNLSPVEISITSLLLQHVSFFALGGSNSISSIDLSNAYNGVGGYNVLVVGILTFVGNWAGPIYWVSASNLLLLRAASSSKTGMKKNGKGERKDRRGEGGAWREHIMLTTLFATIALVGVMAACTALRTHLFIWTVFSPKYLYAMAWTMGQHLVVDVVCGGLVYTAGSRF